MNEKYLIALSTFENAYIQHTKGSVTHKILRNDIQSYVEFLENKLETSKKARKETIELVKELKDETDDTTCYEINKNRKEMILDILDIDKAKM